MDTARQHLANPAPAGVRNDLPEAVIFDMDGVLIDSEPFWRDGFRFGVHLFMSARGLPAPTLTDTDLKHYEGGRVDETLAALHQDLIGHALDIHQRDVLTAAVVDHVSGLFRANPTPIGASVQTLHDLAALGVRIAIATSSAASFLDTVLDTLDLAHLVTVRQSALLLDNGKPHPEVYQRALAHLDVPAHCAMAVEDSLTGLESATRAGLHTLWYTTATEADGHEALRQRVPATVEPDYQPQVTASRTVTCRNLLNAWAFNDTPPHEPTRRLRRLRTGRT
jgi:HAD superfamily hydrolase (TIGR01509 family)